MRLNSLLGVGLATALVIGAARDACGQNAVISGTVTAEDGRPIYSATVDIPQLSIAVPTNAQGHYSLVVPSTRLTGQSTTLRARGFGYRSSSRVITVASGEQTADFRLGLDVNQLEEVVVTGVLDATTQAKLPFSVTTIDFSMRRCSVMSSPIVRTCDTSPGSSRIGSL